MKALLCIHGLLSDEDDYYIIKKNLSCMYDYISIPNIPGHGKNIQKFNYENVVNFITLEYDKLSEKYDYIDVIGYSIGGVIASYLAQIRNPHSIILLAPAFSYINPKNYKYLFCNSSNAKLTKNDIKKKMNYRQIKYFIIFSSIVRKINKQIYIFNMPLCVMFGKNDYLVNDKTGQIILSKCKSKYKELLLLDNHDHFNITKTNIVSKNIISFLNKIYKIENNNYGEILWDMNV